MAYAGTERLHQKDRDKDLVEASLLLLGFAHSFVGSYGEPTDFPQKIVGVGFKQEPGESNKFKEKHDQWAQRNNMICGKLVNLPESIS